MGAPAFPYPYRCPQPAGALRLRFPARSCPEDLDGAWWPYTRDLSREVPHLVNDFPRGRIERLVYSPSDWDRMAEEVFTRYGRIRVGYLPARQTGGLVLLRVRGLEVLRLRVTWGASRLATV